ncbi:methyltransferase family protein [Catelliglobosispora koreensis]|uniref:methyltransferase family protein n=1 Tax=Catelliglobosispora koreensis TaxID=129052 RepID=UPI000365B39F|nr:isoprenylcysteine carboxylmethyltransferase family protein [Catelliglobosispora koreensis]
MNLAAFALYLVFLLVAFGYRTLVQWRRTRDTGLRLDAGPVGGLRWWAKIGFLGAVGLCAAAPVAGLAGLQPLPPLDFPVLRWAGVVLAVAGIAATLAAQLAMGDSWRIGVDPAERTALVTGGPFSVVRNPIFTAFLAGCAGLTLMTGNVVAVLGFAALLAAIEVQVRVVEEPYLHRTHGSAYTAYTTRTGRFIPGLGLLRHR